MIEDLFHIVALTIAGVSLGWALAVITNGFLELLGFKSSNTVNEEKLLFLFTEIEKKNKEIERLKRDKQH